MNTKKTIALATLAVAAGAVLVVTLGAASGKYNEPFKFEGAWVGNVPGALNLWTYTFTPTEPSGRKGVLQSSFIALPELAITLGTTDAEYVSPAVGEIEVTGPNEAVFTAVYYGMKKVGMVAQKVWIALDSGPVKRIGPGKTSVIHKLAIYMASQDTDGDGLPDTGGPVACLQMPTLDTRLGLLPPCKP